MKAGFRLLVTETWFLENAAHFKGHFLFLIGGDWNIWIIFPYIGNNMFPTDFHSIIFQRGRFKPPTRLSLTIINHIITININHIFIVYYQPMVGSNHQADFYGWQWRIHWSIFFPFKASSFRLSRPPGHLGPSFGSAFSATTRWLWAGFG